MWGPPPPEFLALAVWTREFQTAGGHPNFVRHLRRDMTVCGADRSLSNGFVALVKRQDEGPKSGGGGQLSTLGELWPNGFQKEELPPFSKRTANSLQLSPKLSIVQHKTSRFLESKQM